VAAFAALLAYVLLVEMKREPPADPDAKPTPVPILGWEIDDVQTVQFTDGERTTRLEREGEGWRVLRPPDAEGAPANPHTVYFAIHELAGLDARELLEVEGSDLTPYGLDIPALTVTVETRSDTEQVYVGRETADGTAFYVRREGDPRLYVVDHYKFESFFEWLTAPPYQATPAPGA
jgi:hypothetical protein